MASDLLDMVALRNSKLPLFFLTLLVCIALLSAGVFCLLEFSVCWSFLPRVFCPGLVRQRRHIL